MVKIQSFIKIIRPGNVVMAGAAAALGIWFSGVRPACPWSYVFITVAAMAASSFGNVVNDLFDLATDRIAHPDRPLPRGDISETSARIFAVVLAVVALATASGVSPTHLIGTLVPLLLLFLYAAFFKGTPFLGNTLISILVAYALIFGGLNGPGIERIIAPAVLAFLLNFAREIIKDVQDLSGDERAGIATTARIPFPILQVVMIVAATLYLFVLPLPTILNHFGRLYLGICILVVLPLHVTWIYLLTKPAEKKPERISAIIKLEMLAGLLALGADQLF
jgi:geranylgeranylglycerol-phosphate geranylgeranyltransferase